MLQRCSRCSRNFLPRSALLRHSCGEATMRSKTKSFGVEGLGRLTDLTKLQMHPQPSKELDIKFLCFPDSFMPLSKCHIAGKVGRSQGFPGFSWNQRWRCWHRRWHWWGWDGRRSWTCHGGLPKFGSQWMQLQLMDVDKCDFSLILSWFVTDRLPRYLQGELSILLIMQSNIIIWHG